MKKKLYFIPYVIAMVALLIYLPSANHLVAHFTNTEVLDKTDFLQFQPTADGYAYVEMLQAEGDLLEHYHMIGCGFGYTTEPNENKQITVIFKSSKNNTCYVISEKEPVTRQAEYDYFITTDELASAALGYDVKFSVLTMPDGYYDLYIYVHENDSCSALIETGVQYQKRGGQLIDTSQILE